MKKAWTGLLVALLALTATPVLAAPDVARLRQIAQRFADDGTFTGVVLVASEGEVLIDQAYGDADREWGTPNTVDTRFRIGSLTKQFTAAAILLLAEQGKVGLDDPIRTYYPDAPPAWDQVTIRRLLNHTAGIPNYTALPDYRASQTQPVTPEQLIQRFRDRPLDFEPGAGMRYSNSGYALLGHVIERASGARYGDFIRQAILAPLGMTQSGYDDAATLIPQRAHGYRRRDGAIFNAPYIDMSLPYAAGGLYSTAGDLLRWSRGLYLGGLLKAESLDAMLTPDKNAYALGVRVVEVGGSRRYEHDGNIDGFSSHLIYYPEQKLTVAVLSNIAGPAASQMADALGKTATGVPIILPSERQEAPISATLLQGYVGTYVEADGTETSVRVEDGRLVMQPRGQGALPFYAESDTRFFARAVDVQVEFHRENGQATSFTLFLNGAERLARRRR